MNFLAFGILITIMVGVMVIYNLNPILICIVGTILIIAYLYFSIKRDNKYSSNNQENEGVTSSLGKLHKPTPTSKMYEINGLILAEDYVTDKVYVYKDETWVLISDNQEDEGNNIRMVALMIGQVPTTFIIKSPATNKLHYLHTRFSESSICYNYNIVDNIPTFEECVIDSIDGDIFSIKDGKIIYHDNCYHQMRGTTHPMGIITVSELQLLYKIHSDKEIKNYIF